MHRSTLWQNQHIALRMALWSACTLFTFWICSRALANPISIPDYASFRQNGFYLWAFLFLCVAWLYIKRSDIRAAVYSSRVEARWILFGLVLVSASMALLFYVTASSSELSSSLFAISFVIVAQFTLFFGKASKIPLMLLGLFGVAVTFPMLLENSLLAPFSRATAVLSISTLRLSGMPITLDGVTVTLHSLLGYSILTKIDTRCAGSDSLAIFIAVFGLMLIDRKPQNKALIGLLVLGLIGTYLQNFARLLLLFTAGYYYGSAALWIVHDYSSYILFPFWFLVFAIIYLKYTQKPNPSSERIRGAERTVEL